MPDIFISEFVSGGGVEAGELAAEGMAMLGAVVEDFLAVPGWRVITTYSAALNPFPHHAENLQVIRVHSPAEEAAVFAEQIRRVQAVLLIAPEFHRILLGRVRQVEEQWQNGIKCPLLIGSRSEAVSLCGDKLRLAQFLADHQIPTIPTASFDLVDRRLQWPLPIVVKPRDGAGSLLTFRINTMSQLDAAVAEIRASNEPFEFIQQPFVDGQSLSMSAIKPRDCDRIEVLPLGEQVLSSDGRFQYLGANVGHFRGTVLEARCRLLVEQCVRLIPDLGGYLGFDLLLPADQPDQPLVVEINPRLTSSYLAYRRLARGNLAAQMLGCSPPSDYRSDVVCWRIGEAVCGMSAPPSIDAKPPVDARL